MKLKLKEMWYFKVGNQLKQKEKTAERARGDPVKKAEALFSPASFVHPAFFWSAAQNRVEVPHTHTPTAITRSWPLYFFHIDDSFSSQCNHMY
jgi:hypothetical protein